jgi:hypothetical protein
MVKTPHWEKPYADYTAGEQLSALSSRLSVKSDLPENYVVDQFPNRPRFDQNPAQAILVVSAIALIATITSE